MEGGWPIRRHGPEAINLRSGGWLGTLNDVTNVAPSDTILAAIRRAVAPISDVQAALLFGSRAAGSSRSRSDIDIALLLDPAALNQPRKDLLQSLLVALSRELASDRLDLTILNTAPPKLAFHVLKDGKLAFERDPVLLHRFRVRTYSRHADYQPIEQFFRTVTRARAQREATDG